MSFVHPSMPSILLGGEKLERNQKLVLVGSANHTEGVLLSMSRYLRTAFCHDRFLGKSCWRKYKTIMELPVLETIFTFAMAISVGRYS